MKVLRKFLFTVISLIVYGVSVFTLRNKSIENLSSIPVSYRDDVDVIFLGSSVTMNGIYPLQLYHDQGIASYNLGCGNQSMAESYYIFKQALRQTDVKLVVLDTFYVYRDQLYLSQEHLHYVTDKLSLPEKYKCVTDILPLQEQFDFFYELGAYHDRWESLEDNDFQDWTERNRRTSYGAKPHYITGRMVLNPVDKEALDYPPESEERYLRMIIEECRANDIDVMLMLAPIQYTGEFYNEERSDFQGIWNYTGVIADEYGIDYLNFMYHIDELGLDLEKDTDGGAHLNVYGARKLTSYIGDYIRSRYDVPDVRSDAHYGYLDRDYEDFIELCERIKPAPEE